MKLIVLQGVVLFFSFLSRYTRSSRLRCPH